jgi:DNA-directed RNA polymerase beta subunit
MQQDFSSFNEIYPGGPLVRMKRTPYLDTMREMSKVYINLLGEVREVSEDGRRVTRQVVPKPFVVRTSTIENARLRSLSGMMMTSEDYEYLLKYVTMEKPIEDQVMAYNAYVDFLLERQLRSREMRIGNVYIVLEEVYFDSPTTTLVGEDGNDVEVILFPYYCMMMGTSYDASVYCKLRFYIRAGDDVIEGQPKGGGEFIRVHEVDDFHVGNIPVMIGSKLDNLQIQFQQEVLFSEEDLGRSLTDDERADLRRQMNSRLGEQEDVIPGGFISKGINKVIPYQDKLRTNQMQIFDSKGLITCRMTCYTPLGTSVVIIKYNKEVFNVSLRFMGDDWEMNIGSLCSFLDPDFSITDVMKTLLTPSQMGKFTLLIATTLAQWGKVFNNKNGRFEAMMNVPEEEMASNIYNDLFSQVDHDPEYFEMLPKGLSHDDVYKAKIAMKLNTLCLMLASYVRVLIGDETVMSKDDWGLKRLTSSAKTLEQLSGKVLSNINKEISEKLLKGEGLYLEVLGDYPQEYPHSVDYHVSVGKEPPEGSIIMEGSPQETKFRNGLNLVIKLIKDSYHKFTQDIGKSFSSGVWGVNPKDQQVGVVEPRDSQSVVAALSHMTKIITRTGKEAKLTNARAIDSTSFGIVDPHETPEGKNMGLVRHKTLVAWTSIDKNFIPLLNGIDILGKPDLDTHPLVINGVMVGWTDITASYHKLNSFKFTKEFFDITVAKTEDTLFLFTDGGRVLRPTLIAKEGKTLALDHDTRDVDELLLLGLAVYLDILEIRLNGYLISPSPSSITAAILREKEVKEKRDDAVEELMLSLKGHEGLLSEGHLMMGEDVPRRNDITTVLSLAKEVLDDITTSLLGEVPDKEALLEQQHIKGLYDNALFMVRLHHDALLQSGYTHTEISFGSTKGISSSMTPKSDSNMGPRNVFQAAMTKQSITTSPGLTTYPLETTSRIALYPTHPMFVPSTYETLGLNRYPTGEMVVLAISTYEGYNQEDAIVINKKSVEAGRFRIYVRKVITRQNTYRDGPSERQSSIDFGIPPIPQGKVSHLDERGLPPIGYFLRQNDAIIGMVQTTPGSPDKDVTEYCDASNVGFVHHVMLQKGRRGSNFVKVVILQVHQPNPGDKFALTYSQKGVAGITEAPENLPYVEDSGMIPDMVFNPLGFVTRMTLGLLIEIIVGRYALITGRPFPADPFVPIDIDTFMRTLRNYGFNEYGLSNMVSGKTGEVKSSEILIGPAHYKMLRHLSGPKEQATGTPRKVDIMTKQPTRGAGIRSGEMETQSLAAHLNWPLWWERLFYTSDRYQLIVCTSCDCEAIFSSEIDDYLCSSCDSTEDIRMVDIPYASNMVRHIYKALGVGMEFIYGDKPFFMREEQSPEDLEEGVMYSEDILGE